MLTYAVLFKWTDEGAKNVKETVNRAERGTQLIQQMGGRMIALYWTQGAYDIISLVEFPDEDAAEATLLQLASTGAVRTETMRAFSAEEMRRFLSKLG
jgi:uncharacterized protein with GYD domain